MDARVTRVTRPMTELARTNPGRIRWLNASRNVPKSPARRLSTVKKPVTKGGDAIWGPSRLGPTVQWSVA